MSRLPARDKFFITSASSLVGGTSSVRLWPLSGIPVSDQLSCTRFDGRTQTAGAIRANVRTSMLAHGFKSCRMHHMMRCQIWLLMPSTLHNAGSAP
jgi:hypothetical protein